MRIRLGCASNSKAIAKMLVIGNGVEMGQKAMGEQRPHKTCYRMPAAASVWMRDEWSKRSNELYEIVCTRVFDRMKSEFTTVLWPFLR